MTNAGTIPDRGLYGVFQVDGGGRVGELDEEMVYEAREGQTFMLGASTWRIEEITRDRVLVSPAPGVPGAVPFWKGEGVGRPYELGRRIGEAVRTLSALSDESASDKLRGDYHLDDLAVRNLVVFLREQERHSALPTDRTVVVERFRDEIGDWRVCVLTLFGGRVHAPWSMALAARLRDSLGLDVQSLWSDDGIALHFPDADVPPSLADLLVEPQELEDLVVQEVGSTALFGSRFRENAARALLIPRRRPGQRTPLWQQRLKAQSLLDVARRYGSFPIILETYRECLQDVFDLPALRGILRGLATREIDLVEVETQSASPMAASLLFDYIATYMYEDDTPAAERRAQALSLDRELLRELLGQEELRDLIDAGALAEVEGSLRRPPRNADELHDLLRRVGDLREGELDPGFAETLVRERRAFRARIGAAEAVVAAEDAGLYRDAFGVMPPGGLPEAFLEPVEDAVERVLLRHARSHGPFTTREVAARYALEEDDVEALLAGLEARDLLVRGELRPGGVEREWCDPDVLRRIRRASLAVLRRQVEPAEQAALGRFLPSWHGIDRRASLREALVPLQGLALPVALWESEILPRRVPGYQPAALDQLCASGEVVWVGAGLDRVALFYREDAPVLGAPTAGEPLEGPVHEAIRAVLARSAEFWLDLVGAVGIDAAEALPVLWELVWNGEVTNDAWAPLRAKRRYGVPSAERRPRRFSRSRVSGDVATAGRWSLTGRLFEERNAPHGPPDRRALAELLLERQGIVTRDGVRAEGIPGGYGAVYGGAAGARDRRRLSSRLLRRGARRRAVRAPRRRRAAPRAPRRGRRGGPRARGGRSRATVRGRPALAEARFRAGGARRRCARRPPGRRSRALRGAGRTLAHPAPRTGSRLAPARGRRPGRLGPGRPGQTPLRRALRRAPRRGERCPAAARRGRLPRRAAARCPAALTFERKSLRRTPSRPPPSRLRARLPIPARGRPRLPSPARHTSSVSGRETPRSR